MTVVPDHVDNGSMKRATFGSFSTDVGVAGFEFAFVAKQLGPIRVNATGSLGDWPVKVTSLRKSEHITDVMVARFERLDHGSIN